MGSKLGLARLASPEIHVIHLDPYRAQRFSHLKRSAGPNWTRDISKLKVGSAWEDVQEAG